MKKNILLIVALVLLVISTSSTAYGQCFRLVGCGGPWPQDEPIFAHQVDNDTVLFVAILPEWAENAVVYWGDRVRQEYSKPLPVVMSHRYKRTGTFYKIRIRIFSDDGEVDTYTYSNVEID